MDKQSSFWAKLISCGKDGRLLRFLQRRFIKEPLVLYLDVSNCNLQCVMCPNGRVSGLINNTKGMMSYELFKKIIDKCVKENVKVDTLIFGNWGEPLLNPDISKMIKYAKLNLIHSRPVVINTNLNYLQNSLELLESGINSIKISISGMTREVYQINHKRGNIEVVLGNILKLVETKKRYKKKKNDPLISVFFHDFIYNKKDQELARRFCIDNGIKFYLRRMYISSVEDNIRFQKNKEEYSKIYREFIDLDKEVSLMTTGCLGEINDCFLRKQFIVVNFDGQLYRCCAVFEEKYFMGSVFDFKIKDISEIESSICKECINVPISWRKEVC